MKKLSFILCGLLVAFEVMKVSFVSTASGFQPPILPNSSANTAVTAFTNALLLKGADSLGIQLKSIDDYRNAYRIMTGNTLENNFEWQYLPADTISENLMTIYDSNGNVVDPSNATIAFANDSNSMINQSFIFDNSTGDILRVGDTFASSETSLQGGLTGTGMRVTSDVFFPVLSGESNSVYNPVTLTTAQKEFVENNDFGGYMISLDHQFVCYVPNGLSRDSIVCPVGNNYNYKAYSTTSGELTAFTFYCTSYGQNSILVKPAKLGGYLNIGTFKTTGTNYYGQSWGYCAEWTNSKNPMYFGGWIYCKAPRQADYNNYIALGDFSDDVQDVFVVEPWEMPDRTNSEKIVNNITRNYYYNENYDNTKHTTINNYPIETQNINIPDYSITYNYYQYVTEYQDTPNTGADIGSIPDTDISNGIPILSNLEKRFPFSIPFDIYNLLQSLNDERVTPYIDETVVIPVVDYEWHIQYDLSEFDDIASLFRTLFLISFIIGLAYFSYDHFFGS